jgi:hypothetical protein
MASFPIKTDPMSSLSGYFQMRQPRAADMQPSPPQSSGFSAPSATESAFHVLASNPPDTTKSATFSTPPMQLPEGGQTQAQTFGGPPTNLAIQGKASAPNIAQGYTGGHTPATRFSQGMSKGSTQPAYTSAGDNVPKGGKGGTGFTSFNQYFGANAPAAQRAAQTEARKTGRAVEAQANQFAMPGTAAGYGQAYNAMQNGLDQFRAGQNIFSATPEQASSAGAFDAMLAARANPQAAVAEQQRLGSLANYFAEQQSRAAQQEAESSTMAQQQYEDALFRQRQADAENEKQRRFYESQQQQQHPSGYANEQEPSEQYANVPEEYDDVGYDGY